MNEIPTAGGNGSDQLWLLLSLALGLVGIAVLLWHAAKKRNKANLAQGCSTFLTCAAAGGGLKICWLTASNAEFIKGEIDRLSVFLGGLILVWFACETVIDLLKGSPPTPPP